MAQRQDSLTDQMIDVVKMAAKAGCYDAVDWITRVYGAMEHPLALQTAQTIRAGVALRSSGDA